MTVSYTKELDNILQQHIKYKLDYSSEKKEKKSVNDHLVGQFGHFPKVQHTRAIGSRNSTLTICPPTMTHLKTSLLILLITAKK